MNSIRLAAIAAAIFIVAIIAPWGAQAQTSTACDRCMTPCIETCKVPGGGFNKLCMHDCDDKCRDACKGVHATPLDDAHSVWACSGPVGDCRSTSHEGTFGCAFSAGAGSTQGAALSETRHDCEENLKTGHGGNFHCHDLTQVTCIEKKN